MKELRKGKVHSPFIGLPDGIGATFGRNGIVLIISVQNLTQNKIREVSKGTVRFALVSYEEIGLSILLVKFGKLEWEDMPVILAQDDAMQIAHVIPDGKGYVVNVILTDSSTGMIEGIRQMGLGAIFSREISRSLLAQGEYSQERIVSHYLSIREQYTTKDLVGKATASCCKQVQ